MNRTNDKISDHRPADTVPSVSTAPLHVQPSDNASATGSPARELTSERVLLSVFLTLTVIVGWGYHFPHWNHADLAPQLLAMSDAGLYSQDFFIREMSGFTPRTYYNYTVFGLTRLGLDLPSAYFVVYVVGIALLVTGLLAIADGIGLSRASGGLLIFVSLVVTWGDMGMNVLCRPAPLPASLAAGFSVWGIHFCLHRRWIAAFGLFGVACLFQFLVGLLPALLVGPALLYDAWRGRRMKTALLAATALGIGAGLVYVPMHLAGGTGSGLLTSDQFVQIYGHIRVPHHVVPTAWPVDEWRQFAVFFAASIYLIVRSKVLSRSRRIGLLSVIGMMGICLLVNYCFVEVWPVALIAKMQFARTTPYGELAALIGLVAVFDGHFRRKQWGACAAMLAIFTCSGGAYGLAVFAMARDTITWLSRRYPLNRNRGMATLWAVSLLHMPLLPILLVPQMASQWVRSRRRRIALLACGVAVVCGYFVLGVTETLPAGRQRRFDRRVAFDRGPYPEDVTRLAQRFESQSAVDSLILIPPGIEQFRFYSKRSVMVDTKSFPLTDRGILDWKQRMEDVLGTPLEPGVLSQIDDLYRQRSAADLADVARRYRCGYILSRTSWHPDMPGEMVDRQDDWTIWRMGPAVQVGQRNVPSVR